MPTLSGQIARNVRGDGGTVSTIKDETRKTYMYETAVWHPGVCGGRIIIVGRANDIASIYKLHERWTGHAQAGELAQRLEQFLETV